MVSLPESEGGVRFVRRMERPVKAIAYKASLGLLAVCRDGAGPRGKTMSRIVMYQARVADAMMEALCMALHPRLGAESVMQMLDGSAELLRKIWLLSGVEVLSECGQVAGHSGRTNSVAWSHGKGSGMLATGGEDGKVMVWECKWLDRESVSLVQLSVLEGHQDAVSSVAFSRGDMRVASASWDTSIRLWDPVGGELLWVLGGHQDRVTSVGFSGDGFRLVSAGTDDSCVRVWGVGSGDERDRVVLQGVSKGSARVVSISPDDELLAVGGTDWSVRLFRTKEDYLPPRWGGVLCGHWGIITCLAFTPDSKRLASGSGDGTVRLWDVVAGQQVGGAMQHFAVVNDVALVDLPLGGNSYLAAAAGDCWTPGMDMTISLWEGEGAALVRGEFEVKAPVAQDAFVGPRRRVVVGGGGGGDEGSGDEGEERLVADVRAYFQWLSRDR